MDSQGAGQVNIKVKIVKLDRGNFQVKNRWEEGDCVTVQIEIHATVSMLKQRISMLVAAHEKWQTMKFQGTELADAAARLDSVEGLVDGAMVELYVLAPKDVQEELGELSDDPDAMQAEEEALPPMCDDAAMNAELTEEQEDAQNKCKGEATEFLEDGDKAKALEKYTEAIMVGNPNAMLLAKRGELLLKMKRPNAAMADATAAIKKNSDSAKALKLRGKVGRLLSMWDQAVADFSKAQAIDYDDDLVDVHKFCTRRKTWYAKTAVRTENSEKKAKADAAAAEAATKKAAAKEVADALAAKEKASFEKREARYAERDANQKKADDALAAKEAADAAAAAEAEAKNGGYPDKKEEGPSPDP